MKIFVFAMETSWQDVRSSLCWALCFDHPIITKTAVVSMAIGIPSWGCKSDMIRGQRSQSVWQDGDWRSFELRMKIFIFAMKTSWQDVRSSLCWALCFDHLIITKTAVDSMPIGIPSCGCRSDMIRGQRSQSVWQDGDWRSSDRKKQGRAKDTSAFSSLSWDDSEDNDGVLRWKTTILVAVYLITVVKGISTRLVWQDMAFSCSCCLNL